MYLVIDMRCHYNLLVSSVQNPKDRPEEDDEKATGAGVGVGAGAGAGVEAAAAAAAAAAGPVTVVAAVVLVAVGEQKIVPGSIGILLVLVKEE